MPFRDAGKTLDACLQSILQQDFSAFELIAVNDHSRDDSCTKITACQDRRFRVVDNPGSGIVDALNFGMAQSRTGLIARMDADDLMRPQRLSRQFACMQSQPQLILSATQVEKFPVEQVKAGYAEYIRWQNACLTSNDIGRQIYVESPFAHPSVLFRKQQVQRMGGYRNGDFPEDYDLWLRLYHQGALMEKIPDVLLDWRESGTRLSRNCQRYSRLAFDRLRAVYLARDKRLVRRKIIYWGAGRKTRKRAAHLIAAGYPPFVWIDIDPRKIGNTIDGATVQAPHWLNHDNPYLVRGECFVLIYVTNHGARAQCEAFLQAQGMQSGVDFLSVG